MSWRIDLHVHTRRHSGCAEFLDPWDLPVAMERTQLDGVLLTEHDQWWGKDELDQLRRRCYPRRVYSGIELTAADAHVIAIGVDRSMPIDPQRTLASTTDLVTGLGGCCILAHPALPRREQPPFPPRGLDAIEIASTVTRGEQIEYARSLATRWKLPELAGSDAHAIDRVGYTWTEFPELPARERDLCVLVRAGLGVATWPSF